MLLATLCSTLSLGACYMMVIRGRADTILQKWIMMITFPNGIATDM